MAIEYPDRNEVEFEGLVLMTFERNGYHDSDWYAVVWLPTEGRTDTRIVGTTRGVMNVRCRVDATPEVRELAAQYTEQVLLRQYMAEYERRAKIPEYGDRVRVVRGRSNEHGTEGVLFWRRDVSQYGRIRYSKIGIALSDERTEKGLYRYVAWDYAKNVEVVNWQDKMPDPEHVAYEARERRERYALVHGREGYLQMV